MAICEACEMEHDDDLLCIKCRRCLVSNGHLLYEDDLGMMHFQCGECHQECLVDPSAFPDGVSSLGATPEQNPIQLETTFDEEWGTDSEGDFPLDPPPKQIGTEERLKIWLDHTRGDLVKMKC